MKILRAIAIFLLCLFVLDAKALNIQTRRFTIHGGRADTLVESTPKPADQFTLSLSTGFSLAPLELGNSAGVLGNTGVVDTMTTFDFGVGYSFSDKVAAGFTIPLHVTNNVLSLSNLNEETVMSLGDIGFAGQFKLVDHERTSSGIGVAVVPVITFPTGINTNFIGDEHVTVGGMIAADGEWNSHYVGVNLGVRFRQEENIFNLRVAQEFLYTAAYHHPIMESARWDAFAEIAGSTVMNDFFAKANTSPVEIKIGTSKRFLSEERPLTVKLVNGLGLGNGYGNPDYRVAVQLNYDHLLPRTKIIERTVTIETVEEQLKELTIYYPTDGAKVDPYYDQKIAGIAQIMKDNPELRPIYIVGHTDNVGGDKYNERLSEKRARQAYDSILQYEISSTDIVWFGVGETDHVMPNDTEESRALNRRTVFTFQKPKQILARESAPAMRRTKNATGSDSFTEVLKEKERGGAFVDDAAESPATQGSPRRGTGDDSDPMHTRVKTNQRVKVKEETVIREGGARDDNNRKSGPASIKGRTFKSRDHDDIEEKTLPRDDKEDFGEPFVE